MMDESRAQCESFILGCAEKGQIGCDGAPFAPEARPVGGARAMQGCCTKVIVHGGDYVK